MDDYKEKQILKIEINRALPDFKGVIWYLNDSGIEFTEDDHCPVGQNEWSTAAALYDATIIAEAVDAAIDPLIDRLQKTAEFIAWLREEMLMQQRLHTEALPKFNWKASALDANALLVLNQSGMRIGNIMKRLQEWEP